MTAQNQSNLPTSEYWPEDQKQFLGKWDKIYSDMANQINSREVALYEQTEILTGQKFFDPADVQNRKPVYRKCFSFGAIAPGGAANFAHGITDLTALTHMYGTCIAGTTKRPLPYPSISAANQGIELVINGPSIQVINGAAGPNISSGFVVIEYLKN